MLSIPANDNRVIISLNDASEMTSLSRTAINRLRAAGQFPIHVELGERRVGFVRTEVLAWIEQRIGGRVAKVAA
jgi:prophage regulatory protein